MRRPGTNPQAGFGRVLFLAHERLERHVPTVERENPREDLVRIGFKLEYDDDDIQGLIERQDALLKIKVEKDFEEDMKDNLADLDNNTLALVKDFGKLIMMSDEEFDKHQQLKSEFRDALKSLEK